MNRRLYLLILPMFLLVSACQKDEIINEYVTPNRTIFYTIPANAWQPYETGNGFIATIPIPGLTNYVNDHDGVLVYLSYTDKVYEQIPQVFDGVSYVFTTRPGAIDVEVQSSDGINATLRTPPGTVSAKIVLIESEKL